MLAYHDTEWGVARHDDQHHLEMLVLEGAQAGLSWQTILNKREGYRAAFHGFDPERVAKMTDRDVETLLQDPGIVRNRLKVTSAIENAKALRAVADEFGTFDTYIWGFVGNTPIVNRFRTMSEVPASTALSEEISKDLKRRAFRFVGPTVIYSYLQATGLVIDHLLDCPRWKDLLG